MENKLIENQEKFESLVKQMIELMDPNPDREGLKETPHRVWKYWNELLEGQWLTNDEISENIIFNKCFEVCNEAGLVVEKDINVFSHCEHHLALMYDMKVSIGYIPNGKVIGLSKLARIAELCAKRLQLQEKIGMDIADVLIKILGTDDVAVVIEGKHSCMTARGVKSKEAITRTACINGRFRDVYQLRQEFYELIK